MWARTHSIMYSLLLPPPSLQQPQHRAPGSEGPSGKKKCGNVRGVLHHNALFRARERNNEIHPRLRVTIGNINKNYFSPRTLTFIILNIRSDSFLSTFRVCSQYSESRREKTEKPTLMFSIKSFLSKWLLCMISLKPCVHKQKKVHKMGKVTLRKHIFVA